MTPEQWRAIGVEAAWVALSAGMLWAALVTRDPTIKQLGLVVFAVDVARWGHPWWKRWRFGNDNPDNSTR